MRIILFLSVLFVVAETTSQNLPWSTPALKPGWERIYVKDVGNFDISPKMEIPEGRYKQQKSEAFKKMEIDEAQISIQQKGLNHSTAEGFKYYARILLNTTYGSPGEYERLNFNINVSPTEKSEINDTYKQAIIYNLSTTKMTLIDWYPVQLKKVNGMSCLHISYVRQLASQPAVKVNTFIFFNYDRQHSFTYSYRISESSYWQSDLEHTLNTFRITEIR